jgi:eukaryotic-like serine/threonine-protein kinase
MDASGSSAAAGPPNAAAPFSSALQAGRVLGNRYEILQLLGEGGMGAVYKARDREVDRFVALKIIRPELASRPDILARFKQELILARQVTHKNVIRIFDLGEADGMKFITMDFVEGRDLKTILRETGKFAPDAAVKIIAQICRALDAAHTEGVVHRDLKPQNIMVDDKGRVTVMDFGIARSMEMPGMTQTGSLVGTPEYMSPEQAKGEDVDARSDIFTLGIIFYELLTGKTPFYADTAYATLLKRTQERARDPVELEPSIPANVSAVVMKCLETNRDQRYLSALDIIHDLGQHTATGSRTALPAIAPAPTSTGTAQALPSVSAFQRYRLWIGAGTAVLILAVVAVLFRARIFPGGHKNTGAGPTVSLLILPFRNASGDTSIDWMGKSLAEMLGTDVGQSESFRTVPSDRLHQILQDLRIASDADVDPATIRRIAEFTNADHVVFGHYAKYGDQIRIDGTLQDLNAQRITPISAESPNEQGFPKAVDELAKSIQQNLTLSAETVREMKAAAFTPSSKSVEALRNYSDGMELLHQGNYLAATKQFQAATTADSNFALAYSRLAQAYLSSGYDNQAQQFSTKAVSLSDGLPPAEKYMIQALNARISNNYDSAIQTYGELLKLMPNDPEVQFEIGSVYERHGSFDDARQHFLRALQVDPKYIDALLAVGALEFKSGSAQASLDYLNRAHTLSIELNNPQAKAAAVEDLGDAYKALNRAADALQNFQQALDIRKQIGDKKGMAASLDLMAQIYETTGKPKEAETAYRQALALNQEIGDQADAGGTMMDLGGFLADNGRYDEALTLGKQALQIERQVGNQRSQSICLNNIAAIYFNQGKYDDALTYFQQALSVAEQLKVPSVLVMTLNNVGETYRKLGQYDQAMNNYLRAVDTSRNAGDKLGIAEASGSMALLFEMQGRYGAALSAEQDAIKNIQDMHAQDANAARIEADYGAALVLNGRFEEGQKSLDDALKLGRALKNDAYEGEFLNLQGERLYYQGDFKSAQPLFEQALRIATQQKDPDQTLTSKFNSARIAAQEGGATADLKKLSADASAIGEIYLSMECSLYRGQALVKSKNYSQARQELESLLGKASNAGVKSLMPQANYWLAQALRGLGDKTGAASRLQQAGQLLQQMQKESGDALLKRVDLKPIAEAIK